MLKLSKPWDSQPPAACDIDAQHPLAGNLVFLAFAVPGGFYEVITGQFAAAASAPVFAPAIDGNKAVSATLTSGAAFSGSTGLDTIAGPHSIFVEASLRTNASTANAVRSVNTIDGDGVGMSFDDSQSVTNGFRLFTNNGTVAWSGSNALGTDSERYVHRCMVTADGTNARFYAKRALNKTQATAAIPTADTARRTTVSSTVGVALVAGFNRVLSLEEFQILFDNPWQLFAPRSIWVPVSTAGGSVTGTSATTNANDTSAASGTTTIVGTSATTNAADTATASGSVGGAVTGTSATTNANDTSSASGTTTVTGTVAYSNANDSAAASGWAGSVSGTAAVTNANDTAQASGTAEGGATDTHDGFWSREWAKLKKREEKKPTIAEVVEIVKESPQVMEVVREEVERKYPQVDYAAVRENVQLQRFIARQLIEAAQEEDDIETLLLMA